jgi:hypothetical protein
MPSKTEIEKAGFSINAINNEQAIAYEKNFRDAFGVDNNASQLIPPGKVVTSIKTIKTDKLGFYVGKKALEDMLKKINDKGSDGLTIKFALDGSGNLELVARVMKFHNQVEGDFSHHIGRDVFSSITCPDCEPQPWKIPPPKSPLGYIL